MFLKVMEASFSAWGRAASNRPMKSGITNHLLSYSNLSLYIACLTCLSNFYSTLYFYSSLSKLQQTNLSQLNFIVLFLLPVLCLKLTQCHKAWLNLTWLHLTLLQYHFWHCLINITEKILPYIIINTVDGTWDIGIYMWHTLDFSLYHF